MLAMIYLNAQENTSTRKLVNSSTDNKLLVAIVCLNAQANKSTCKLVDSSTNRKGYLAFHAPPFGGGDGGGASWLVYLFTSSSTPYTLLPQSPRTR